MVSENDIPFATNSKPLIIFQYTSIITTMHSTTHHFLHHITHLKFTLIHIHSLLLNKEVLI